MTRRHLNIFITVAKTESMSGAARLLFISQPSISQAISELEEHYHTKLFERLSRKLYITKNGEELLEYAIKIINLFNEMEYMTTAPKQKIPLRLGGTVTVGTCLFTECIPAFEKQYANINITICIDNTACMEEMIMDNQLDMAIVESKIHNPLITTTPLIQDQLMIICHPEHAFGKKEYISIQDLDQEIFVMREKQSRINDLLEKELKNSHVNIQKKWITSSTEVMKNIVKAGNGIAILSSLLIEKELKNGTLHGVKVKDTPFTRYINLIYHKDKEITEYMEGFIHIFRTTLEE